MHWAGIPITRRRIDGWESADRTPISPGQPPFSARKKSLKIKNNARLVSKRALLFCGRTTDVRDKVIVFC